MENNKPLYPDEMLANPTALHQTVETIPSTLPNELRMPPQEPVGTAAAPAPNGGFAALAGNTPATSGKPQSKWARILEGALVGLAGGAGAGNFGQGLAGGAKASLEHSQQQKENAWKQEQVDMQKAEHASRVKFMDAQAASLAADTALKDKQLEALPQKLRDEANANALTMLKSMQDLGITPTLVVDNKQGGNEAMTGLEQLTASHGGVPPMFTLNVGNQIVGFDLRQLTQAPQTLDVVNKIRAVQGQAPLNAQSWAQLPQQMKNDLTNKAFSFWNPLPSEENLTVYRNYLNTAKVSPDSPEKAENVARLERVVTGMQAGLDEMNKRETNQAVGKAAAVAEATESVRAKYRKKEEAEANDPKNAKNRIALSQMEASQGNTLDSIDTTIGTLDRLYRVETGKDGKPVEVFHAGFSNAVGAGFPFASKIAGTDAADFAAELETLKAQTFLPQVQQLKGMGALSENEGKKLTDAIGALKTDMSEKSFKESVLRIRAGLMAGRERAASVLSRMQQENGTPAANSNAPKTGNRPPGW